jgi:hypothetical protein
MSALQLLQEGAAHAARAVALLFTVPLAAQAAEPAAAAPTVHAVGIVDRAFEVRVLGLAADLRVVQALRNDGTAPLDLGARVAAASEAGALDRLVVTRDGRTVDLLAPTGGCGDDNAQPSRALADVDESIADVTQLAPGEAAEIETASAATLTPAGAAWRVALPPTVAPLAAHARFAFADGPTLVLVVPPLWSGEARLTLRPARGAARVVELGDINGADALVVPLADDERATDLAAGAVELEVRHATGVAWMTLPLADTAGRAAVARAD